MIYKVEGDILLSKAQLIAHGVAANDPMNQGLAKSLHDEYPAMHKDFHHWCHKSHRDPGEAWLWGGAEGVRVANLLTQDGGYGQGSHPEKATKKNVKKSLKALKKIIKKEGFTSIALPMLATGVGGLKKDDVMPIIEKKLGDIEGLSVYVYEVFRAGVAAQEK